MTVAQPVITETTKVCGDESVFFAPPGLNQPALLLCGCEWTVLTQAFKLGSNVSQSATQIVPATTGGAIPLTITMLNVNNLFNRYDVVLLPSATIGLRGARGTGIGATFNTEPRLAVWSATLGF